MIDISKIREALPHRYPMLLVDRVLEVSDDEIVAIKNVTINEPFFNGHFPTSCYAWCSDYGSIGTNSRCSGIIKKKRIQGNLSFMQVWIR